MAFEYDLCVGVVRGRAHVLATFFLRVDFQGYAGMTYILGMLRLVFVIIDIFKLVIIGREYRTIWY